MKKILLAILASSFALSSFAADYTLGNIYKPTFNDESIVSTSINDRNFVTRTIIKPSTKQEYFIATDERDKIVEIQYSGNQPPDLRVNLGQYYESYIADWKANRSKFRINSSTVTNNDVTVSTWGAGNKVFKASISLNNN